MFKTLIFDLGNVIVPFDFKRGYARIQPLCSYPASEIPQRLRRTDLVTRFETGRVTPEQFVEEFSAILELKTTYEEFCNMWTSIFLPDALIPESFLENLRRRYRLVLLSNTNAIHFEMVRRQYPAVRHFDAYILSHEVGALKPAAQIYEAALAAAGCRPDECFFTDDIADYVAGARRHGIEAVQFMGFEDLEKNMRELGII